MSTPELARLCEIGDQLYARGDAFGATGNLSVRVDDEVWITPTGRSLQGLGPDRLARIDLEGGTLGENRPSKEYPFHLACYRARSDVRAIVHLHAPHTVAVSCLAALDPVEPIPALTPYYVMRVAPLAVVPYHRPGSEHLAAAVGEAVLEHDCMLLRNHGSICTGRNVGEALDRAIELEETARLFLLLRNHDVRHLSPAEVAELRRVFPR
ncbi:MAG TPA: class II aldolase/adducin family protein [Longimicrobiaceae bacterium]|nr:class II aldolase/adducin family protein [Longimicrobiaceae bacterium]